MDWQSFTAVLVTLLIGILTCVISFLNYRQSTRSWHVNVASMRRKERMDNFVIFYSKMVALAYPDTVKGYAFKKDFNLIEKIIESYSNLNMLFDHRFEKDTQLAYLSKRLTQAAIDYFNKIVLPDYSNEIGLSYTDNYHSSIIELDKLLNIFIGVEWSRIKKEVQTGVPVPAEKWFDMYDKDKVYYEKWNEKYK